MNDSLYDHQILWNLAKSCSCFCCYCWFCCLQASFYDVKIVFLSHSLRSVKLIVAWVPLVMYRSICMQEKVIESLSLLTFVRASLIIISLSTCETPSKKFTLINVFCMFPPPLPSPSKLTLLVTEFKYQELSGSHCSLLSTPCSSQEGLVFSSTSRGKKKRGLGYKTDTARAHHAFFSIGYWVCCSCSYWSSSQFIVEYPPSFHSIFSVSQTVHWYSFIHHESKASCLKVLTH